MGGVEDFIPLWLLDLIYFQLNFHQKVPMFLFVKRLTISANEVTLKIKKHTLQIYIGWLSVISSVIPLALRILPIGILRMGKITLSAKGITDEITDNHPIDTV